jgi:hypothetical protein
MSCENSCREKRRVSRLVAYGSSTSPHTRARTFISVMFLFSTNLVKISQFPVTVVSVEFLFKRSQLSPSKKYKNILIKWCQYSEKSREELNRASFWNVLCVKPQATGSV